MDASALLVPKPTHDLSISPVIRTHRCKHGLKARPRGVTARLGSLHRTLFPQDRRMAISTDIPTVPDHSFFVT